MPADQPFDNDPPPASDISDGPRGKRMERRGRIWTSVVVIIGAALIVFGAVSIFTGATSGNVNLGPTPLPKHPFSLPRPSVQPVPVPVPDPLVVGIGTGAGTGPDRVSIPSLGVTAPLITESISGHQLTIPADVHDVGIWSGGGSVTGTNGTVLLAGHINWWNQGNGALYDLASIQPKALVYVTASTGTLTTWSVISLHAYLKADLPQTVFSPTGPRTLALITCGGAFDPTTGHYADNVVVEAVPATGSA